MSRLKKRYQTDIKKQLLEKFGYKNPMNIPKLQKIVIHMGIAEISKEKNAIQEHLQELALLTGQKPIITKAKKSISNFKLREGNPVGLKVTLRGTRMYEFLDRLVNISFPRIRDFRGFTPEGDKMGNYSLGLQDQQIFPELNLDAVKRSQGMHMNFITSATNDEECIELLRLLGVPFKNLPVVVTAA